MPETTYMQCRTCLLSQVQFSYSWCHQWENKCKVIPYILVERFHNICPRYKNLCCTPRLLLFCTTISPTFIINLTQHAASVTLATVFVQYMPHHAHHNDTTRPKTTGDAPKRAGDATESIWRTRHGYTPAAGTASMCTMSPSSSTS